MHAWIRRNTASQSSRLLNRRTVQGVAIAICTRSQEPIFILKARFEQRIYSCNPRRLCICECVSGWALRSPQASNETGGIHDLGYRAERLWASRPAERELVLDGSIAPARQADSGNVRSPRRGRRVAGADSGSPNACRSGRRRSAEAEGRCSCDHARTLRRYALGGRCTVLEAIDGQTEFYGLACTASARVRRHAN